ncbi:hypothetical protein [Brevundimonas faecalis]|uniref:Uncharacterized protein n=1 Tax=Brevundimonas faecalis TaxID=947378 RepID=A0ABV2R8E1_9CAUL
MRRPPKSLLPAAGVLVAGALAAGAPATAQTVAPYVQTASTARPSPTAVVMASRRNAPMIPHGGFARAYPPAEAAAPEAPAQGLTPASAWTGPNAPVYQPAPPPYPDARPAPPSWGGRVLSRGPAPAAPWNARPQQAQAYAPQGQDQAPDQGQAQVYSYVDAPAYAPPPVEAPAEAPTAYYAAAPQPPAYQPPAPPREVYRDAPIPAPVRERAAPPPPAYAPPVVQPPVEAPAPAPAPARVADAPLPAPTRRVEPPAVEAPPPPPPVPTIEAAPAPAAEAAPAPAAEAAPAYDPMAPRRDAPIFRLRAQQEAAAAAAAQAAQAAQAEAEAQARAQAEAQNQAQNQASGQPPRAAAQGGRRAAPQPASQAAAPAPTQPQPYSAAPVPPQETARYYSLHRQAGRQPDAAPLPAPTYLNALPVELDQAPASTDLAEPPAAPNLIRNQDGRVRAAPMTDDPDIL